MPPKCASTESATAVSHQMLWDVRCYKVKQFECFHFAVKRRWGSHVRIKLFIWIIYRIKPKHMNCEFARMWILYNIRCKNLAKMQAMGQVLDIVGILQLTILHFKAESLIEFNLLCVSNSIVQSMTNIYPAYNNVTRDRTRVPWHSCHYPGPEIEAGANTMMYFTAASTSQHKSRLLDLSLPPHQLCISDSSWSLGHPQFRHSSQF